MSGHQRVTVRRWAWNRVNSSPSGTLDGAQQNVMGCQPDLNDKHLLLTYSLLRSITLSDTYHHPYSEDWVRAFMGG